MIKRYRKKPVEIEAVQWTGDNLPIIVAFMQKVPQCDLTMGNEKVFINTLEGTMTASIGDYIIKGVKGEFYPCKPDIFEQIYYEVL